MKRINAEAALQRIQRERPSLLQFKTLQQRVYIGMQNRTIGCSRVREYTPEEKEFVLALFHRSPSAYRHLKKTSLLTFVCRSVQ